MGRLTLPTILIDTREQKPYEFSGQASIRHNLKTGDYSLAGHEAGVTVERKSKEDAYGCVGGSRHRFEECLSRLGHIQSPCIVIESNLDDFCIPPPRTRITAAQAAGAFISWGQEYRIQVFWCPSREWAERVTLRWLMAYWRHKMREAATPVTPSARRSITMPPPGTT